MSYEYNSGFCNTNGSHKLLDKAVGLDNSQGILSLSLNENFIIVSECYG